MMKQPNKKVFLPKVPTVVVVIPYFNGSNFIERAVLSVLGQTVAPNEFIIVNDGSTQSEGEFLHELAFRYKFRIIDQANGGQGSARNTGVGASTADYICFLDQDDYYLATHIETLLDAKPTNDPHFGWVYGDLFEAEGDGSVVRTEFVTERCLHPKQNINDLLGSDMYVLPSASLISRKAFEAVGGFDPQFMGYEDDDLFLRIFRRGFTNYFTATPVTVWCIHTESTSYSIRMSRSRLRYFKKLVALFPDDPVRMRYYLRDLLIPRFNGAFIGDAVNAILRDKTSRDRQHAAHKDELIAILKEYAEIIYQSDSVPSMFKRRLRMQLQIILSGSKLAIRLSKYALVIGRRMFSTLVALR